MTEKQGVVYAIRMLPDNKFCYVGQTKGTPEKRWSGYATARTPMARILQMFGLDNFDFVVLERVSVSLLNAREKHWIAELNTVHPNGLNMNRGGSGGGQSASTKAKRAAKLRQAWLDDEYRKAMSAQRQLTWQDPEYKAKHSAGLKTVWEDQDYRSRVTAKRKEIRSSAAARAQQSQISLAAWADPDSRRKRTEILAASNKRRSENAEWRKKNSEANRRKAADPEYRAKLSEAAKRRWAKVKGQVDAGPVGA